jgi:lipopolysaccharide transport system ATP-binding protein
MSDDVLVRVENVSKRFCRSLKRSLWYGLQDLGSEIGGRRHGGGSGLPRSSADVQLRPDEFWAVKDISFDLKRGRSIGLIGKNGAGKTTLLRMLNGLIKPDTGYIKISGRVGALIALGAGFNPLLSGRENIYINGSVLGMTKQEVDNKISQIIDFAELSDSIDAPVQTYSSGMQVRLGFGVAATLEPELLILDEVLAVGDMNFQAKCWNRLGELRKKGCSFIIVSHQMLNIERLATDCILIDKGAQASKSLDKYDAIRQYEQIIHAQVDHDKVDNSGHSMLGLEQAGSKRIYIESASIQDSSGRDIQTAEGGETVRIILVLTPQQETLHPIIEITLRGMSGTVFQANNKHCLPAERINDKVLVVVEIPSLPFCNDNLAIAITIWDKEMTELYDWTKGMRLTALSRPRDTGNVTAQINWHPPQVITNTKAVHS